MKSVFIILGLLLGFVGYSQSSQITIEAVKDNDTLIFFGNNNATFTQDVTLEITEIKGLNGKVAPIKKRILPNSLAIFHKLGITGEYNYDFKMSFAFPLEFLIKEDLKVDDVMVNQGIVIFDKTGCERCKTVKAFLDAESKPYQTLNIVDNKHYNTLMWNLLQINGYQGNKVKTPVIMVDGEISYNHDDLIGFLRIIK